MAATATAFKQSAQKKQEPVFDFEKAVAEAYEMFPEIRDRVFFIDVCAKKVVHPDIAVRDGLQRGIDEDFYKSLGDWPNDNFEQVYRIKEAIKGKSSFFSPQVFSPHRLWIYLYTRDDQSRVLGYKTPLTQELYFTFDHELAHAMIPDACGKDRLPQLTESVADAYAVLRHFQRFGENPRAIRILSLSRAKDIMYGLPVERGLRHFTSPLLEEILERKEEIRATVLSPEATAQTAWRLAMDFTMDDAESIRLERDIRSFNKKNHIKDLNLRLWLRTLARESLTGQSPGLSRWGAFLVCGFLSGKFYSQSADKPIRLKGKYWDDLRKKLKSRPKRAPKPQTS